MNKGLKLADRVRLGQIDGLRKPEYPLAQNFPTDAHAIWRNYWMASYGINPIKDAKVITVPPPLMVANMRVGNMRRALLTMKSTTFPTPWAVVARTHSTVVMVTHDVDEAVLLSDRIVMMTNGPAATIGEILTVPLERPRNRVASADDLRYVQHRKQVLDFLDTPDAKPEAVA